MKPYLSIDLPGFLSKMTIFCLFISLFCMGSLLGDQPATDQHLKVELVQENKTIQPGQTFWLALRFQIEEGWHIYWKNPGDAGAPLEVNWQLPPGFSIKDSEWPYPKKFVLSHLVGFGYENEAVFLVEVEAPSSLKVPQKLDVSAELKWLVCNDQSCQPGSTTVRSQIATSEKGSEDLESSQLFREARAKLPHEEANVAVKRQNGALHIEVPLKGDETADLFFFPEQPGCIDISEAPKWSLIEKGENKYYSVTLNELDHKNSQLHGVLVLSSLDNIEAIEVDSLIDNGASEIAMADDVVTPSLNSSSSHQFEGGFLLALVFAFLGGLILNLMPCVLPVLSFKIMGLMKMVGHSRQAILRHGLCFTMGVLLSFWALAAGVLLLRAYGQNVGWGFQLQEPAFVIILASFLFLFALNLFGIFEAGVSIASWSGQKDAEIAQQSKGYGSSFFNGILATAVATPCTGPFLGSAVGFAVTLPVFKALLIFTFLGLGMSFPYVALCLFPSLLRFLPKPGAWMETFKQFVGFILLATVLWLLWVFSAQTNTLSLMSVLAGFLLFSLASWVYGRGCTPLVKPIKRYLSYGFVALLAIAGIYTIVMPSDTWYAPESGQEIAMNSQTNAWNGWEPYSAERLAEARANGTPVLIDFTARWCLICQANHLVLSTDGVSQQLTDAGVIKMRADWTKHDPAITEALSQFGRSSVPLYVLYGSDSKAEPVILPQVLTPDIVRNSLENAIKDETIALE